VATLWSRRRTALLRQIGLGCVLLLAAVGSVPLLAADQQWLPDGAAIGAVCGLLLILSRAMIRGCCSEWCPLTLLLRCCSWKRGVTSGLLLTCCAAPAAWAQQSESAALRSDEIIIPYVPGEPPLRADQVFVPHDQFLRLFQQAYPDQLPQVNTSPLGSPVISAWYKTTDLLTVDGGKQILRFEARYV
ncbi:MAG: hypothetical protein ACKPJD_12230, partial [Planctomycetaceae bacterium]